ncbi:RHS repeat-associated core domain-containing protein [Streptomyces sp. NPDC048623]|uniref:RHS repeat-associated core domain-containing protein n=1 Tax=Streptomyces sp. NPDC048623 TaxID=3155761 RepID=UPI00344647D4
MTPFGAERGGSIGTWPTDRGFLDKTADKTTGLTHIGAREYDSGIGQFISVDPVLQADKAQTMNGYTYGANNPAMFADPTGKALPECVSGMYVCRGGTEVVSKRSNYDKIVAQNNRDSKYYAENLKKWQSSRSSQSGHLGSSSGRNTAKTGNDNAPFNSVTPTPSQYSYFQNHILPEYEGLIAAAKAAGWDLSAELWRHYREASGDEYVVEFDKLRGDPGLRKVVMDQLHDWSDTATSTCAGGGPCEFTADSKWLGVDLDEQDSHFGIGHAQVRITGEARPDGKSTSVEMNVQVYKDWNFDKGK